eukprot:GHRR01013690.1.p1 GENE.GHRR01013690.1~~GHRR01013690.1.p1  ORF type:complete len:627 (+),score=247.17 GHRR01013690.1:529-2409(+)
MLGGAFSSAILEAAKRRAQEQAAAAQDDDEPAAGADRKRPKHEPIVWQSPKRTSAGELADGRPAKQESLQERLQREAAEFRQQQQQRTAASPGQGRGRPQSGSRHSSSRAGHSESRSRSQSPGSTGEPPGRSSRSKRRSGSRSDSRSSSREDVRQMKKAGGGRWLQQDIDEQGDTTTAAAEAEQQQQQQPKSRWAVDDDEGSGGGGGDVEEGEALAANGGSGAAAIDEELEELNRRERAELDADEAAPSDSPRNADDPESDSDDDSTGPFQVNMLEESRRVEEYERLNRISEGTYGVVHRARSKTTGQIFALKKLKLETVSDGFPQTSYREMNILLSLHHPNIVNVTEVVIGSRDSVYMVMEYVEHDLKYVLELQKEKKAPPFSIGQVKCLMQQLLEGVAYLHHSWVIHRDLKTSNLLYSNTGQLKICDFGLARQYGDPLKTYTSAVVTLWYRAIERLLGAPRYDEKLDMWSVGCIMAELILGEPLFQGRGEIDQIKKIFQLLGTPNEEDWPGWDTLPDIKMLKFKPQESQLRQKFFAGFLGGSQPVLSAKGFELLSQLLAMNPDKRISAEDALKHDWFKEVPRAVNAALMPSFPARHLQTAGKDGGFRDKLLNPSPGAIGAGFAM